MPFVQLLHRQGDVHQQHLWIADQIVHRLRWIVVETDHVALTYITSSLLDDVLSCRMNIHLNAEGCIGRFAIVHDL